MNLVGFIEAYCEGLNHTMNNFNQFSFQEINDMRPRPIVVHHTAVGKLQQILAANPAPPQNEEWTRFLDRAVLAIDHLLHAILNYEELYQHMVRS
jgi:hypothetical protein